VAWRVIERLFELQRKKALGGRSGTADAKVPNSSSPEAVGVGRVVAGV
jgi:hypothetical protein